MGRSRGQLSRGELVAIREKVYIRLTKVYGWTPQQIAQMTAYQQLRYLENINDDAPLDVVVPQGAKYFRNHLDMMKWFAKQGK